MRHTHGGPDATRDLAIVQAAWCGDDWVGSRAGGLAFRLAPDAVEEEVAVALGVGFGFGGGVEVHDLPLVSIFAGGFGRRRGGSKKDKGNSYRIFATTRVRSSSCSFVPAKVETASVTSDTRVAAESVSLLRMRFFRRSMEN